MKRSKMGVLCSAIAAVLFGAILTCLGTVPTTALSYGVGPEGQSLTARTLTRSLPMLSSLPQRGPEETEPSAGPPASRPVFAQVDYTVSVPKAPTGAERIVTKTYASGLSVNNSSPKKIDLDELLEKVPDIDLSGEGPTILIVHTHTSESYNDTGQDWYSGDATRTADNSRNMVHMGNLLEQVLTQRGYRVIHSQKRHDEDFNYSYTMSNQTVRDYLEAYPSIAVVIDLHRDSLIDSGGTKYRPTVDIDGEQTAQIMLLMGVGNDTYPHPNWKENLSLAARIQKAGETAYPGLMRPILVRPSRYNQYLSKGAILVELGACGNTPAEAEAAARRFGEICADALDQIREDQE